MDSTASIGMDGFTLGKPALVCRWRLAGGDVLLKNRHMRALSKRIVNGKPVSPELVAWAKQHIEWTLAEGSLEYPNGVLMLMVDESGAAAMTVGPYEELRICSSQVLLARARSALVEQDATDVAPETIFAYEGDTLIAGTSAETARGGCASLVLQLATTLGIPTVYRADLLDRLVDGRVEPAELFLASDEHGIVEASDCTGPRAARFSASYKRLFEAAVKKG